MIYPTITEYIEAIRFSEDNFDKLTNLVPVLKDNGEPYYSSGNFAVVFKMKDKDSGKLHAVKCFLKDQEGREESYRKISNYLETIENRYLIKTKFLEKELFVDTKSTDQTEFPVVVMDWVEGVPLDVYIREKINDKMYLEYLCYTFSLMAQNLIEQEFAHGDLKPDNILVKEDGMLVLVDYDGMYVPEMFGERARELGSPDFQHPDRKLIDFDKHLDDFSLASILLSLKLISIDPSLLDKFGDKDRLLFSQKDYREFLGSEINAEIFKHFENKEVLNIYHLFLQALGRKMCVWNKEMWKLEVPYQESFLMPFIVDEKEFRILQQLSVFDDDSRGFFGELCVKNVSCEQERHRGLEMIFDLAYKTNSWAQCILGNCYMYGQGLSKNFDKASEWYTKSSNLGNPEALYHLGRAYYRKGKCKQSNYTTALLFFSKSFDLGFFEASYYLGLMYLLGYGLPVDFDKTFFYWDKYNQNCEPDQDVAEYVNFYSCHKNDLVCSKNNVSEVFDKLGYQYFLNEIYHMAFDCYMKSACLGNINGLKHLAECYYSGYCVDKDYCKALEYYSKVANQGDLEALYYCGCCNEELENWSQAFQYYLRSAEGGYGNATEKLADCYFYGKGIEQNYTKAVILYSKISEPSPDVQKKLGDCYANGWGVQKDYEQAKKLWNKANERKDFFVDILKRAKEDDFPF